MYEKSIFPLRQCSDLEPIVDNLVSYGSALFDYGNLELSYTILKKAVEIDSTNEKAMYFFGLVAAWVCTSFLCLMVRLAVVKKPNPH